MNSVLQQFLEIVSHRQFNSAIDTLLFGITVKGFVFASLLCFGLKYYFGGIIQCDVRGANSVHWDYFRQEAAEMECLMNDYLHYYTDCSNLQCQQNKERKQILYYQWVPLYLLLWAVLFYVTGIVCTGLFSFSCKPLTKALLKPESIEFYLYFHTFMSQRLLVFQTRR